VNLVEY